VLLMGYEMYRLLSSRRAYIPKPKKKKKKDPSKETTEVIDVDEEDTNKNLMTGKGGKLGISWQCFEKKSLIEVVFCLRN
jgi:hypothetical protein